MHETTTLQTGDLASIPVSEHRLENGLRLLLHHDDRLPLITVNLWYHVGSKNEVVGKTGLAHLFEHMLFQGSQNVGTNDHFAHIQQVGGVANGSTWYDRTNYFETVPAHCLEMALWLESDRMGYLLPALTDEKLENQREVVMNERRQRIDNPPYGTAFETLNEMLYPEGHPYRWPVIGYMDDIAAATYDDVADFFRAHYAPDRAVLTLAGDFDESRAIDLVGRYFGDLVPAGTADAVSIPDLPTVAQQRTVTDNVPLTRYYLAFRGPAFGRREWFVADLLTTIWSGGKSSLFYQDMVYDKRLAQDVSAYIFPTEMEATFAVVATAAPQVPPEQLEHRLHEHLFERIDQLDEARLAGARNQMLSEHFEELQTVGHRADLLSMYATYLGNPESVATAIAAYQSITLHELRQFAATYLTRDALVSLRVDPAS